MELTLSQRGEIVGSFRSIELSSNGEINTLMANVRGAVDAERLAQAISALNSSTELNYSGELSDKGMELYISGNAGVVSKVHFTRDSVANFNAEAQRLARCGKLPCGGPDLLHLTRSNAAEQPCYVGRFAQTCELIGASLADRVVSQFLITPITNGIFSVPIESRKRGSPN
ncbi:hypothetical protein [Pseudomonas lurida]|uniref:hypothetical protein n=1 Tax=Pseudomonas lurida TaxID=244566 RepID=UPI00114526DB|nr:hypothetical protein [Pseudomonas lurida]